MCIYELFFYCRYCTFGENVLIGDNTSVSDETKITKSIIGNNCKIGKNVIIEGSHIMNDVIIKDNCKIINSYINSSSIVEENCKIEAGTIIGSNVTIEKDSELKGNIIQQSNANNINGNLVKILLNKFTKKGKMKLKSYDIFSEKVLSKSPSDGTDWENESDSDSNEDDFVGFEKTWSESASYCSSISSEDMSLPDSPEPEDTNSTYLF